LRQLGRNFRRGMPLADHLVLSGPVNPKNPTGFKTHTKALCPKFL
jgi:hypothetical protein